MPGNYSPSCYFEAIGREIPAGRQLAERLLGKFRSRLCFYQSTLRVKVTPEGFLPALEMTCLSSYNARKVAYNVLKAGFLTAPEKAKDDLNSATHVSVGYW